MWPGVTAFPDWFSPNASRYWNREFAAFFAPGSGVDIDGLWIDMNEPSNFPCNFPCDDPDAAAVGYPPAPPPLRQPPYALPGWPCDFTPQGCPGTGQPDVSSPSSPSPQHVARAAAPPQPPPQQQFGLPGRDLLYPKYAIHNKAPSPTAGTRGAAASPTTRSTPTSCTTTAWSCTTRTTCTAP